MNLDFLRIVLVVALPGIATAESASAPTTPPSEQVLQDRIRVMVSGGDGNYLPEIRRALAEKRLTTAEQLATKAIVGPSKIPSPQLQAYVRSLAYLHRAEARRGRHAEEGIVNADIRQAALLGNLTAVRQLVDAWVSSARNGDPATARPPKGVAMDEVLAVGVELDEAAALNASATGFGQYSALERQVIALRNELRARDSSFLQHARQFAQSPDARDFLRTHFLVGADIPPSEDVPGRDVMATLFDESNLRSTIARGLGFALPEKRPESELSLREIMEVTSWIGDMSGLATAYHFTTEEPGISARHVVLQPQRLATVLGAGDTLNVRCGGIAHTAVVLRVDRERDEVQFVDPLYEYWQPSNNSCVTSFSLVHYKYGYYASVLKLSEVVAILDSVQSMRTFAPPSFVSRPGPIGGGDAKRGEAASCRGAITRGDGMLGHRREEALKQDLFKFFNFDRLTTLADGDSTIEVHMVQALEFRGDVMLRLRSRNDCVASASLFLRRSFIGGSQRIFANDLLKSFMSAAFGRTELDALQSDMIQPESSGTDGRPGLREVFSGVAASADFSGVGRRAHFENVIAESGAHWLELDAW